MNRKDSAFRTNAVSTLPRARTTPAIAGPTMKLKFWMLAHALFAGPSCCSSLARAGR